MNVVEIENVSRIYKNSKGEEIHALKNILLIYNRVVDKPFIYGYI